MGRVILIRGNGVGITVGEFIQIHAQDNALIQLVSSAPEEIFEGKTLTLHNIPLCPDDILTYPESFKHHNHEKINSLPYHRRSRGCDFLSKQLRAKPARTQKNRYSRKVR